MQSRFTNKKSIPSISTRKSSPATNNFAKGIFTYKPNDTMSNDEISLAQNARFERVGEYKTRRGYTALSEPVGKASYFSNKSETHTMTAIAEGETLKCSTTAQSESVIYSLVLTAKSSDTSKYGLLTAFIYINGALVGTSSVNPKNISEEETDFEIAFPSCPKVEQGDNLEIVVSVKGEKTYEIGTIEDTLMVEVFKATEGEVIATYEANIEGEKTILFVFKSEIATTLYRMSEDGEVNEIRTLPEGVTAVRFAQNLNKIRYADGVESPRLIDPETWTDTAITTVDLKTDVDLEIKVSNIMDGSNDNIMYFDAEPNTQAVWTYPYGFTWFKPAEFATTATLDTSAESVSVQLSTITKISTGASATPAIGDRIEDAEANVFQVTSVTSTTVAAYYVMGADVINSYDKFDRDFRQNFPAILTGDPLTAMFNLGSVVYIMTRKNKYQMFGQTADVWTQGQSQAQNGTFSQESLVCDLNYAYFANDNGIFIFDGSSEASITEKSIQNVYDAIPNKETIKLDMFNNRLYVYYASKGATLDSCLVYNINLRVWESFDTGTYINATCARKSSSNRFICGSSRIGQVLIAEDQSNDYNDLGAPIAFNLETAYQHFGSTSQLKRITKWRPEFGATENDYSVQCGYATDFSDKVTYAFSIDLKNNQTVDENYEWNDLESYGIPSQPTKKTTKTSIYDEFYRCQIRYQHVSSYEPVLFKSHTLTIETQRLR